MSIQRTARNRPMHNGQDAGTDAPGPVQARDHGLSVLILLGLTLAVVSWFGPGLLRATPPEGQSPPTAAPAPITAGQDPGTPNPWALQPGAADRIRDTGLPLLANEGTGEHFHAHLDVYADGKAVSVPAGIGFADLTQGQTGGRSPVHTHDTSGIIHVEAQTPGEHFTLAQFLREWGVLTGNGTLGGHPAGDWSVFVNGTRSEDKPDTVLLHPKEEIALVQGISPVPVPATYAFPANLDTPVP
ncbi:hypothetical protein [Arthrobacter bambusae]|uniref:hypothetical protein n=1 Tax=Arthrobacter bambusae TaxID=1338426 RepID=UPI00277DC505|nr:hypothetical protein [Arthrobacter bambusae]MDQ0213479.1 hypothetical protein [Arthrobacter bambusae]MDQ0237810.1 hypothetical protein [Arthrobacter bambusae]